VAVLHGPPARLCWPAVHALVPRDGRPEPFRQGDPLRRAPLLASYATFVSYVQHYFFLVNVLTDRFAHVEIHATRTRSSMGKSPRGRRMDIWDEYMVCGKILFTTPSGRLSAQGLGVHLGSRSVRRN
jgi:hypothetical protein